MVAHDPECARRVPEPPSCLGGVALLDEVGPHRLVLSLLGRGRLHEKPAALRYRLRCSNRHTCTFVHGDRLSTLSTTKDRHHRLIVDGDVRYCALPAPGNRQAESLIYKRAPCPIRAPHGIMLHTRLSVGQTPPDHEKC